MSDGVEVLHGGLAVRVWGEGDERSIVYRRLFIEDYPALLRALIAQAGGVEVKVRKQSYLGEPDQSEVSIPWDFPEGPALLLPMEGSE